MAEKRMSVFKAKKVKICIFLILTTIIYIWRDILKKNVTNDVLVYSGGQLFWTCKSLTSDSYCTRYGETSLNLMFRVNTPEFQCLSHWQKHIFCRWTFLIKVLVLNPISKVDSEFLLHWRKHFFDEYSLKGLKCSNFVQIFRWKNKL